MSLWGMELPKSKLEEPTSKRTRFEEYSYAACLRNSEKVVWRVDDVLPASTTLDPALPLWPAEFTPRLQGLTAPEAKTANQLFGLTYIHLLAFVEEYIIVMAARHAHAEVFGDNTALRALLRFSEEEIKHQTLFRRYLEFYARHFGRIEAIKNPVEIASVILEHAPMAVLLITIHLELLTQHHYKAAIKNSLELEPAFVSVLKHHWLEESHHAKLGVLELLRLVDTSSEEERREAYASYLRILNSMGELFREQGEMNAAELSQRFGHSLEDGAGEKIAAGYQHIFGTMIRDNKVFSELLTLFPR